MRMFGSGGQSKGRQRSKPPLNGSTKSVLQPSDLSFLGYYRFPDSAIGNGFYMKPGVTTRTVGASKRVFTFGDYNAGVYPLLEFEIPASAPNTTMGSAAFLTLVKNWGDVRTGHTITDGGTNAFQIGGLYWDESRNAVWWTYADAYVPTQVHPSLSCTVLNDGAGTSQSFGPWRFSVGGGNMAVSAMTPIPAAFTSASTPGKTVAIKGAMKSGVAQSPFGPNLYAFGLFDPVTTPANTATDGLFTITPTSLVQHDLSHKKTRDTRYKTCGWTSNAYNCALGQPLTAGTSDWGGTDSATAESDNVIWACWIDTPTKHGLLFGGYLCTTPTGYTAPGDADGYVHKWYGNYVHGTASGSGYADNACCHGQPDPYWGSTGPGNHYVHPLGWIYNPNDLAGPAAGTVNPWALTPTTDAFEWKSVAPGSALDTAPPTNTTDRASGLGTGMWGPGAFFDSATRRLYVPAMGDRATTAGQVRPLIMVFSVAS